MVWSEGGRGSEAHSPELVVTCVLVVTRGLVITHVLIVARVRSSALAVIREARWPLWLVAVHARRG